MNWCEHLHIDRQDLIVLADAYTGYARALSSHEEKTETLPVAASSQLIGAVYRALATPGAARQEFHEAAKLYFSLRHPYGRVLAVCGEDSEVLMRYIEVDKENEGSRMANIDILGILVANCWLSADPRRRVDFRGTLADSLGISAEQGTKTVGRLMLPLRLYVAAINEISRGEQSSIPPSSERFRHTITWLERAAEPVAHAMGDHFHWRRLHSKVMPVEPEVVGTCVGLIRVWEQEHPAQDLSVLISKGGEISPLAAVPLEVASQIIHPDQRGRNQSESALITK